MNNDIINENKHLRLQLGQKHKRLQDLEREVESLNQKIKSTGMDVDVFEILSENSLLKEKNEKYKNKIIVLHKLIEELKTEKSNNVQTTKKKPFLKRLFSPMFK